MKSKEIRTVLGITMGVCSSAALYKDGHIIACISEERFVKKKNYDGYPKNAIEFCLSYGNVSVENLDYVALASNNIDPDHIITHQDSDRSISDWIREMHEYWYPIFYSGKKKKYIDVFKDKIDLEQYPGDFSSIPFGSPDRIKLFTDFRKQIITRHLNISAEKIAISEHHLSHALYGLLGSPERKKELLVFTADGFGDHSNAAIYLFREGRFTLVYETANCNIGRLYRYITLLMGMKPGEHEYKVMGLAAYPHPRVYEEVLEIFKETLYVDGIDFKYKTKPVDHYFWFQKKLEGQRFDAIAGGLQKYVEDLLTQWIQNAVKKFGVSTIAFSGGVSMNIKANMEILRIPEVTDMSVPGSGGDESLAIGAIFALLLEKKSPIDDIGSINNLYLGNQISRKEIDGFIKAKQLSERFNVKTDVSPREIAKLLSEGEIIGRFAGRMEFGQRSLGNRSILADPSRMETVKTINDIIKHRDFWMPFAPTILYEDCEKYLHNPKGIYSPFMTIGFETKTVARKDLIAALHPADMTARPQMLKKEINPDYYSIVEEFKSITGIGGLLNTSFNLHGLPIVESLSDALHVMDNSKLKYLLIENVLFSKKNHKD